MVMVLLKKLSILSIAILLLALVFAIVCRWQSLTEIAEVNFQKRIRTSSLIVGVKDSKGFAQFQNKPCIWRSIINGFLSFWAANSDRIGGADQEVSQSVRIYFLNCWSKLKLTEICIDHIFHNMKNLQFWGWKMSAAYGIKSVVQ